MRVLAEVPHPGGGWVGPADVREELPRLLDGAAAGAAGYARGSVGCVGGGEDGNGEIGDWRVVRHVGQASLWVCAYAYQVTLDRKMMVRMTRLTAYRSTYLLTGHIFLLTWTLRYN